MPGAYAHLTLINQFREPARLENLAHFPRAAIPALLNYSKYSELGAVSPDYPYLAMFERGAAHWADLMHYERTGEMIQAGVRRVRGMSGPARDKCLAWLLGYASHVATDVTIHPVVELKVGTYKDNKTAHRRCEMHQDAYIFQRLKIGQVGRAEHLGSGVGACGEGKALDEDVRRLWEAMLQEVHPDEYGRNHPDPGAWHRAFRLMVDGLAEGLTELVPFARHVAAGQGLTYPAPKDIDRQYLEGLKLPGGRLGTYDEVFERAIDSTGQVLAMVAGGCLQGDQRYQTQIANWDLDTGKDLAGRFAFWSIA